MLRERVDVGRAEILRTVPSLESTPGRQSLPREIRSVGFCGSRSFTAREITPPAGRLRHRLGIVPAGKILLLVRLKRYWRRFIVLNGQKQPHWNVTSATALDFHQTAGEGYCRFWNTMQ